MIHLHIVMCLFDGLWKLRSCVNLMKRVFIFSPCVSARWVSCILCSQISLPLLSAVVPALFRTYQIVKLLYCFGIFITFALQFYVPAEILIPPAVARVPPRWERAVDLLLRTVLVIFTCEWKQCWQKQSLLDWLCALVFAPLLQPLRGIWTAGILSLNSHSSVLKGSDMNPYCRPS